MSLKSAASWTSILPLWSAACAAERRSDPGHCRDVQPGRLHFAGSRRSSVPTRRTLEISASLGQSCGRSLDEQLDLVAQNRPLNELPIPISFFDALYEKVRRERRVLDCAILWLTASMPPDTASNPRRQRRLDRGRNSRL
jgi:hypothetical protein